MEHRPFHQLQLPLLHCWRFHQYAIPPLIADVSLSLLSGLVCHKLFILVISVVTVYLSPFLSILLPLKNTFFWAIDFVCGSLLCSHFSVWSLALCGNPIDLTKQRRILWPCDWSLDYDLQKCSLLFPDSLLVTLRGLEWVIFLPLSRGSKRTNTCVDLRGWNLKLMSILACVCLSFCHHDLSYDYIVDFQFHVLYLFLAVRLSLMISELIAPCS